MNMEAAMLGGNFAPVFPFPPVQPLLLPGFVDY